MTFRLKHIYAVFIACIVIAGSRPVQAEELVTDLSQHLVAVQSNFTGTKLLLFGAVVILVASPVGKRLYHYLTADTANLEEVRQRVAVIKEQAQEVWLGTRADI